MSLCLAAGLVTATIAADTFTLGWTHSIAKTRWEEDWHVAGRSLQLDAARIAGTGAGMEPPNDAILRDGVWHYQPVVSPLPRLVLAHSPYAAGYELCRDGRCRPLADFLPGMDNPTTIVLEPCP
jgi:hypothetical protein